MIRPDQAISKWSECETRGALLRRAEQNYLARMAFIGSIMVALRAGR
jgi:hypothetical protein